MYSRVRAFLASGVGLLFGSVGFGLGVRLRSLGCWGGLRVSLGGAGEEPPGIRWRGYPGCSVHGILNFCNYSL